MDVIHLSTLPESPDSSQAHSFPAQMALGRKSRSSQDLTKEQAYPAAPRSTTDSPSGSSGTSLAELPWNALPEEHQAVEGIQHSRKQLEDEIDVREEGKRREGERREAERCFINAVERLGFTCLWLMQRGI